MLVERSRSQTGSVAVGDNTCRSRVAEFFFKESSSGFKTASKMFAKSGVTSEPTNGLNGSHRGDLRAKHKHKHWNKHRHKLIDVRGINSNGVRMRNNFSGPQNKSVGSAADCVICVETILKSLFICILISLQCCCLCMQTGGSIVEGHAMNERLSDSNGKYNELKGSSRSGEEALAMTYQEEPVLALAVSEENSETSGKQLVPRITIQPNDLIAIEGESAELNCDAEGEPEPIIEWYHNGELIKSSTHTRTTMGGSIQFLDIHPSADRLPASLAVDVAAPGRRASDEGIYYCVARNSFGQAKSRYATLQVAYIRDEFKVSPKDRTVSLGDSVAFECMPHAWPEPRFQWRHNGRPIELAASSSQSSPTASPSSSSSSSTNTKYTVQRIAQAETIRASPSRSAEGEAGDGNVVAELIGSQLVIKHANKSDAGQYTCLAETKGSHRLIERESRAAYLSVLVKPFFIEAPTHVSAQVGETVSLRCRMGGEPEPVISWRKQNGQPLSDKTRIDPTDKTLTLEHLSVADSAAYVCEGENSVGSAKSVATVSVQSRPKFTVQPNDQEIEIGSRVQLKCAGEASPQPILFWYKEGHRQLMFAPASAKYSKKQQVNSHNKLDNAQFQQQHPQAAALLAPQPSQDYRNYGSIPNSDTSPAINKLFTAPLNQAEQQPSYSSNYFGNRIFVDNQGSLNIINVTMSDSGYYACALISQIGSVLVKAKITVKDSNQQSNPYGYSDYRSAVDPLQAARSSSFTPMIGKYDLLPPPVIKLGAENQTLPTNTSATLLCDVVSQVQFKIQWFFELQPLQEEPPRVTILESGALSLNNLRTTDTGIYTCVVSAANDPIMPIANSYETLDTSMLTTAPPIQPSTSHSALLKVVSPMNPNIQFYRMDTFANPSAPGPAYLISTNENDDITIAWSPPADSGMLPIKEYIVEHYDTSQEHLGWRVIHKGKGKELLRINGLSPDGSHFFVIRAANGHGVGPSSPIAGPIKTAAGESRYQMELQRRRNPMDLPGTRFDMSELRPETNLARERLMTIGTNLIELTPVSSTSVRLLWSTQPLSNSSTGAPVDNSAYLSSVGVDTFLEGYSIRYRAIGIGESLLGKPHDTLWNTLPASLPLVTSYVPEEQEETSSRLRREVPSNSYYDYSQEFNEVRVVDHNTEHYTINGLKPFTVYQFFVVPYYKDIDGVPSNILAVQTGEDRPSVAPPNLTIRPINNTAIRLLWLHIPAEFSNGILRGYVIRSNKTEGLGTTADSTSSENDISAAGETKMIHAPLASLKVAPLNIFNPESRIQPTFNGVQQYVVMYDVTNLTYKSFYSVQVAGATSIGAGPWSEAQNFVMEPGVLSQNLRASTNEFDDVISKSMISSMPYPFESSSSYNSTHLSNGISTNWYYIIPICLLIVSVILVGAFLVHQRNNQKLVTWKKTISERFTNKFYIPSVVDHRGPSSLQQNIYDHQQHLIYSGGSSHMVVGPSVAAAAAAAAAAHSHQHQHHTQIHGVQVQPGTIWATNGNNNCLNSSATGSLSSHGGLLPLSSDPGGNVGGGGGMRKTGNVGAAEQILLMNTTKDTNPRFVKNDSTTIHSLVNHHQNSVDSSRSLVGGAASHAQQHQHQNQHTLHQQQHHLAPRGGGGGGDYYSVINNAAEYEELDQQQRNNMRLATSSSIVVDRHQTGSSNSDTSCPSSVTRLIPNNQNFNREYLTKNALMDSQRQELIVQQQMGVCRENKQQQQQPFVTMLNGGGAIVNNNGAEISASGRVSAQHQNLGSSLSPYATTNLASQIAYNQQFMHSSTAQHNVTLGNQIGQNFMHTNGGAGISTMDDSSSRFMLNNTSNQTGAVSSFRTLQRQPMSIQAAPSRQFNPTISTASSTQVQTRLMHNAVAGVAPDQRQFHQLSHTTLVNNPLSDMSMNLYEHIEYNGSNYGVLPGQQQQQQQTQAQRYHQQRQLSAAQAQQSSNDLISSSTSSGSVKSSTAHNQQSDQQSKPTKSGPENEAHDLRVFSSAANNGKQTAVTTSSAADCELAPLNEPDSSVVGFDGGHNNDADSEQADETTAFRQKPTDSNQRVRQLSKRKRQQQRNRLHNQNQKLG